jgi:Asp-tRNA(Asn)/Glu-tRNA(Gln) amidotransferase A subunit family amidase
LEAAKQSTERYAQGKPLSVLDGVPIGVKDDTDVEGWVNHWGMDPNMTNPNYKPCDQSLWPVLKLQEAGAIVIGKNRMHELGSGAYRNPLKNWCFSLTTYQRRAAAM